MLYRAFDLMIDFYATRGWIVTLFDPWGHVSRFMDQPFEESDDAEVFAKQMVNQIYTDNTESVCEHWPVTEPKRIRPRFIP